MNAGDPAALPLLPSGSMPDAAGRWGNVQAGGRGQPPPRSAFVKAPRGAGCCLLSRGCAPPPGLPCTAGSWSVASSATQWSSSPQRPISA